jgi:selina-4(15),7(11)-diene synthase
MIPATEHPPVPRLRSPFPAGLHPEHRRIQERCERWADRTGVGSPRWRAVLAEHRVGEWASRALPRADEAVVQLVADQQVWVTGLDDLVEVPDAVADPGDGWAAGQQPGPLAATFSLLLRVAQRPACGLLPGVPLADGLRDLSRRAARLAGPAVAERWLDGLRQFLLSLVWEARHRAVRGYPPLADYALMRLHTTAAPVIGPFLEVGGGYAMTPAERHHPVLRALDEMAQFLVGWENDLLSFAKELDRDGYALNAVRIVQEERGGSLAGAVAAVVEQRDRVVGHFLATRRRFAEVLTVAQTRFLDDVEVCLRSAQDWGGSTERYRDAGPGGATPVIEGAPVDQPAEPLPFPALDWWWDL